ncbi:MAG: hypothetical protein RLZZ108_1041 [Actinomycetota bacterium]
MLSYPHLILGLALSLGLMALYFDVRSGVRFRAASKARAAWPSFVDSAVSALNAGHTRFEAFQFAISRAASHLPLQNFADSLERDSLRAALATLQSDLKLSEVDEFSQLVLINESLGGAGLASLLKAHAKRARFSHSLHEQIATKNMATLAVAKMGVAAPWILLALLMGRRETAQAFSQIEGLGVLIGGLVVCVLAYRLIAHLGANRTRVRVYG